MIWVVVGVAAGALAILPHAMLSRKRPLWLGAIAPALNVGLIVVLMYSNEQSRGWGRIVGYAVGLVALLLVFARAVLSTVVSGGRVVWGRDA